MTQKKPERFYAVRMFNGKEYRTTRWLFGDKRAALRHARDFRKDGYNARVVRIKDRDIVGYAIYKRKKGR